MHPHVYKLISTVLEDPVSVKLDGEEVMHLAMLMLFRLPRQSLHRDWNDETERYAREILPVAMPRMKRLMKEVWRRQ